MVLRGLLPYLFLLFICLTCLWNMAGVESAPTFSVSSSYALIGQRLSPRAKSKGSEMKTATPARKPVFSPRESEQVCWKKYSLSRQGCSKDADRIAPDAEGIISLRRKCIENTENLFTFRDLRLPRYLPCGRNTVHVSAMQVSRLAPPVPPVASGSPRPPGFSGRNRQMQINLHCSRLLCIFAPFFGQGIWPE